MVNGDTNDSHNEHGVMRQFPSLSSSSIIKKPIKYTQASEKGSLERNGVSTASAGADLAPSAHRSVLLFKPVVVLKKQQSQYKSRALNSPIVFCRESSDQEADRPVTPLKSMYGSAGVNRKRHIKSKNGISLKMAMAKELGLYADHYHDEQHHHNSNSNSNNTNNNSSIHNDSNGTVEDEEYWDLPYDPFYPTDYKRYKESDEYLIEQHEWNLFLIEKNYVADQRLPKPGVLSDVMQLDRTVDIVKHSVSPSPVENYGRKILENFGWKQGQGLGANEDRRGIKTALRLAPVDRRKRKIGRIIDHNR